MKNGRLVKADSHILEVCAKVSDRGSYTLLAQEGRILADHDGYVPNFFPGQHYGDYLIFHIEIDTGKILNWKPPTAAQLGGFIKKAETR